MFRLYNKETGKIKADLIALADEVYDESEDLEIFDSMATWKRSLLPGGSYTIREMLVPVFFERSMRVSDAIHDGHSRVLPERTGYALG